MISQDYPQQASRRILGAAQCVTFAVLVLMLLFPQSDATAFQGTILSTSETVQTSNNGNHLEDLDEIEQTQSTDPEQDSTRWASDIHRSRIVIAPTALPLEKNALYITAHIVGLAEIQYGLTERTGLGMGTFWGALFYVDAKHSRPLGDKWTGAIGSLGIRTGYAVPRWTGLSYASLTRLHEHTAITLSGGAGYNIARGGGSVVWLQNIGLTYRIGNNVHFVSENWFAYGLRFGEESIYKNPGQFEYVPEGDYWYAIYDKETIVPLRGVAFAPSIGVRIDARKNINRATVFGFIFPSYIVTTRDQTSYEVLGWDLSIESNRRWVSRTVDVDNSLRGFPLPYIKFLWKIENVVEY